MDPQLFASLLDRANSGAAQLVSDLLARSWPGGAGDRTEPAAREWLRRWAPKSLPLHPPVCTCPAGRCGACN